jgi:aspartokinase
MARVAKKKDVRRETAAHKAREFIDAHPSIRDCLQMDLINLSALSRKIVKETDVESQDAALIACRRYIVPPGYRAREAAVKGVLRKSKIEIHSKVAIITVRPSYDIMRELGRITAKYFEAGRLFRIVQGSHGVTLICDDVIVEEMLEILSRRDVIQMTRGLVEMIVTSPDDIAQTPGVIAYLLGALASSGINLNEAMSCHTDTIFLVSESDMMPAFQALNKCLT